MNDRLKQLFDQGVADKNKDDLDCETFPTMIEQVFYSAARGGHNYEDLCKFVENVMGFK